MLKHRFIYWAAAVIYFLITCSHAQMVDRETVNRLLEDGEVGKARTILKDHLSSNKVLSRQDSIYIYKNLGIIHVSVEQDDTKARLFFFKLLSIDPSASLSDTYAGYAILEKFSRIKRAYQETHGGTSLIPSVAVMDVLSVGLDSAAQVSLTRQFIDELTRYRIFKVIERGNLEDGLQRIGLSQRACKSQDCFLDLARKLVTDKLVLLEFNQVDSVYSLTLKYLDVRTGEQEMSLNKIYTGKRADIYIKGLPELADELTGKTAAWLNVSVQPDHAELVLDGAALEEKTGRVPVNAGKHLVCAKATGFATHCQELTVEKADAVTYTIALTPNVARAEKAGEQPPTEEQQPLTAGPKDVKAAQKQQPKMVWYILGGMAVLSLVLALAFNTAD